MLTVKLLVLEIGALLVYAGITGRSVGALLRGDNTASAPNRSLSSAATGTSPATAGQPGQSSGLYVTPPGTTGPQGTPQVPKLPGIVGGTIPRTYQGPTLAPTYAGPTLG